MAIMYKEGLNIKAPLLNFGVSVNKNNTDENILAIDHPSFLPVTRNMLLFGTSKFLKVFYIYNYYYNVWLIKST